jgi:hypothetical protein
MGDVAQILAGAAAARGTGGAGAGAGPLRTGSSSSAGAAAAAAGDGKKKKLSREVSALLDGAPQDALPPIVRAPPPLEEPRVLRAHTRRLLF